MAHRFFKVMLKFSHCKIYEQIKWLLVLCSMGVGILLA